MFCCREVDGFGIRLPPREMRPREVDRRCLLRVLAEACEGEGGAARRYEVVRDGEAVREFRRLLLLGGVLLIFLAPLSFALRSRLL